MKLRVWSTGFRRNWWWLSNAQQPAKLSFQRSVEIYTSEDDFSHCQVSSICNLCKPEAVLILVTEVLSNWLEFWSQVHRRESKGWSLSHEYDFQESNPTAWAWGSKCSFSMDNCYKGFFMKSTFTGSKFGTIPSSNLSSVLNFLKYWNRNVKSRGSCKTECFLMRNTTSVKSKDMLKELSKLR